MFHSIAQPDIVMSTGEQDTPGNKDHKSSSDSERKWRTSQEYQVVFACGSCRFLRWGWTVSSVFGVPKSLSCPWCGSHGTQGCSLCWWNPQKLLSWCCAPPQPHHSWQSHVLSGRFLDTSLCLCLLPGLRGVAAPPAQSTEAQKHLQGHQGPQQWRVPSTSSSHTKPNIMTLSPVLTGTQASQLQIQ